MNNGSTDLQDRHHCGIERLGYSEDEDSEATSYLGQRPAFHSVLEAQKELRAQEGIHGVYAYDQVLLATDEDIPRWPVERLDLVVTRYFRNGSYVGYCNDAIGDVLLEGPG